MTRLRATAPAAACAQRDLADQLTGWSLGLAFSALINWAAFGPPHLPFPGRLFVAAIAVALDALLLFVVLWEIVRWRHREALNDAAGAALKTAGAPARNRMKRAAKRHWLWLVLLYLAAVALTAANLAVFSAANGVCPACATLSAAATGIFWVGASIWPCTVGLFLVMQAPRTVVEGAFGADPTASGTGGLSARPDWSLRILKIAATMAAWLSRLLRGVSLLFGLLAIVGLIGMIAALALRFA